MTDIFLERDFDPPLGPADVTELALETQDCLDIHRVEWLGSFLSTDGRRMFCWFRAPDLESARIAMRQIGTDTSAMWRGSVHNRPGLDEKAMATANVLVERQFGESTALHDIQDIEDASIWCLEARNVNFIRTFYSSDEKRMMCLYEAPDAESVRQAQREAGVPFAEAWAFVAIPPEDS